MRVFLKIKIKSLAAEAAIIRKEEARRPGGDTRTFLHEHRVNKVRKECRAASLAYGFLRGRPYKVMEAKCHEAPQWSVVERLILKYGEGDPRELTQRLAQWKDEAVSSATLAAA